MIICDSCKTQQAGSDAWWTITRTTRATTEEASACSLLCALREVAGSWLNSHFYVTEIFNFGAERWASWRKK